MAFMSDGRIALQAPLDELLDEVRLLSGTTAEVQALMQGLGATSLKRTTLSAGRERVLARLRSGTPLPPGTRADAVTLEDLFMELT
jgi:ABC-2 type transport system ATP-binding protein